MADETQTGTTQADVTANGTDATPAVVVVTPGAQTNDGTTATGDQRESGTRTEPAATAPDPKIEALEKQITDLRKEAAQYRTNGKTANDTLSALQAAIAQSLGIQPKADEKPDPAKLTQQLADLQTSRKADRLSFAVQIAARDLDADPELTAAFLTVSNRLEGIDVDDQAYAAEVRTRVEQALKDRPRLKNEKAATVTPEPTKEVKAPEVARNTGGENDGNKETPLTVDSIQAMTPDQVNADWARISAFLQKQK